jgi:5-carboxymethyl-2-hydroxymuconate isomerase
MPHLKLEYTENVQWKIPVQEIFHKLQSVLIQHAKVKPENCKHRAIQLKDYLCSNNGSPCGFIHLEISMLSGRSETVKTKIGSESTKIIREFLESVFQVQVSAEIRDMDRQNYFTSSQL